MAGWETAVVGGLVGVLFLWAYLSFNIGKKTGLGSDGLNQDNDQQHIALRLLLILMTFTGMYATLWIMKLIADPNSTPIAAILEKVFIGYAAVFMFVSFYYVVMFIIWTVNLLRVKK